MNTVILFTDPNGWSIENWVADQGGRAEGEGAFSIESGDNWISVINEDDIFADYECSEIEEIRGLLPTPLAYVVSWRGDELLSALLDEADQSSVVDNDHGLICRVAELRDFAVSSWKTAKSIEEICGE